MVTTVNTIVITADDIVTTAVDTAVVTTADVIETTAVDTIVICGAEPRAGSLLCDCGVEDTPRYVGASGLHETSGDLESVCNEAVQSRGKEAWYPQLL